MKKLSLGIWFYLFYMLVISVIAWTLVNKSLQSIEQSVNQAAEEVMVDAATLLSQFISNDVKGTVINTHRLNILMSQYLQQKIQAKIYQLDKTQPNLQVYVTDARGQVIFDSTERFTGKDFSLWRDVNLTLAGEYGARSSPFGLSEDSDDALYIAAPIFAENNKSKIIGVVTVYKSVKNLDNFIQQQTDTITRYALIIFVAFVIFGAIFTWGLSNSIQKLVVYANSLAKGEKIPQPQIYQPELEVLATAINNMRVELDGKEYVENYIHLMAHELKSPITGIQNAAELLLGPIPEDKRLHFTSQILDSTQRMTLLIDHLLCLAKLEKKQSLDQVEAIDVAEMLKYCITQLKIILRKRNINSQLVVEKPLTINGDRLLIEQAITNIIDNAIDFSPENSSINITIKIIHNRPAIIIRDQGVGIPEYALPKLFDHFFSLSRPNSNQKSTGLGLRFVKEIMALHRGQIKIKNYHDNTNQGVQVILLFEASN